MSLVSCPKLPNIIRKLSGDICFSTYSSKWCVNRFNI